MKEPWSTKDIALDVSVWIIGLSPLVALVLVFLKGAGLI
tara:strand:+ start:1620 stop:1736 length:117 start_codon:yes stop_codon:yes gene_type:complete